MEKNFILLVLIFHSHVQCFNSFICHYGDCSRCACWHEKHIFHVDCSRCNLTTIPSFPTAVNILNLQHNLIKTIQNETFKHLNKLEQLNLSRNELQFLEPLAFDGLQNMKELDIGGNYLLYTVNAFPFGVFKPLVSLTNLRVQQFVIDGDYFNFPDKIISDLHNLTDLVVDAVGNINLFGKGFAVTNLKRLKIGTCKTRKLQPNTFSNVEKLEVLELDKCPIKEYSTRTLFPLTVLKYLAVTNIVSSTFDATFLITFAQSIPPLIEIIKLSRTVAMVGTLPRMFFWILHQHPIRQIHLDHNNLAVAYDERMALPPKLRLLNFSNNELTKFRYEMTYLSILDLHGNKLGPYLASEAYMGSETTNLSSIDLSRNNIQTLTWSIFHGHSNLKSIKLSHNSLSNISFDLAHLVSLKHLDLSNNSIQTLSLRTTDALSDIFNRNSNFTIDLSENILRCSCQTVPFLQWMLDNKKGFPKIDTYKCKTDKETVIVLLHIEQTISTLRKECTSYVALYIAISVGIATVLIATAFGLIYRYRWRLRYLYYMTRTKYKRYRPIESGEEFKYNAFISYADNDKAFILKGCIPNLEQKENLKLCIHQRDFIPGEEITHNITNGIHESKKTICIITRAFLESYYCMFEFNMARMESIYSRSGENILFLVFLEQILPRELPLVMLELVQQESYIEYPNDEQGNVVFWEKIREAIT